MAFLDRIIRLLRLKPNPKRIAQQLRKPHGAVARKIADKMNASNAPLYDLAFREMKPVDGAQILEIGFGNGRFFENLFALAADLQLTGLDYAPEMVKAAKEINQEHIQSGALELALGASDAMPFPDATFDTVFCINVLYFWDMPADHIQEIQRVLKPGGRFFVIIRTKETLEMLPFSRFGFNIYKPGACEALLRENGFLDVKTVDHVEPPMTFEGGSYQLKSLCISGSKRLET